MSASVRDPKDASRGASGSALVILAAGLSSRFGRPKQLEPVGPSGEALLDYALHDALLAGFERFLIVIQESMRSEFERHLAPAIDAGADIVFVPQQLTLPHVLEEPPPKRTKPWGTGFAVLAAAQRLDSPFAVCNADDFYGRGAYALLMQELRVLAQCPVARRGPPPTPRQQSAVAAPAHGPVRGVTVTYPLGATLSARGGVSRGLCQVGPDGFLTGLEEGLDLTRNEGRVEGRTAAGKPTRADPNSAACMSLWGFAPEIGTCLAAEFSDFLATGPGADAEFQMTEAVGALVASGRMRCRALQARDPWMGVTFPGDRAAVAAALRTMVESGTYPRRLRPLPKGRPSCN